MKLKNILVIDDEKEVLSIFQSGLSDLSQKMFFALDGVQGLEIAKQDTPDVIISDYYMPNMDGLELLKSLKERSIDCPVIWTTGYATKPIQREAWISGVYEVFEKPFDMGRIRNCILSVGSWSGQSSNKQNESIINKLNSEFRLTLPNPLAKKIETFCKLQGCSVNTYILSLLLEDQKKVA